MIKGQQQAKTFPKPENSRHLAFRLYRSSWERLVYLKSLLGASLSPVGQRKRLRLPIQELTCSEGATVPRLDPLSIGHQQIATKCPSISHEKSRGQTHRPGRPGRVPPSSRELHHCRRPHLQTGARLSKTTWAKLGNVGCCDLRHEWMQMAGAF